MSISDDLERARHLALAAQEEAAKELLLSLMPLVEQEDRDDLALEVLAQLAEIYLVRTAYDGVVEGIRRIRECLATYTAIRAGTSPEAATKVTMTAAEIDRMICRYTRRTAFLAAGLAAARGEHDDAATHLRELTEITGTHPDLEAERSRLICYAHILLATGLCDDDLYAASEPLWAEALEVVDAPDAADDEEADYLFVAAALGYGRFCVETGRLAEAQPWLRRAEARARTRDWRLSTSRAQLEQSAAKWATGDIGETQRLVHEEYPVIAEHARAHDVSRSWLYFGLIRLAVGALQEADEFWGHAERHWREIEKPLHIHRIMLQRSWVSIFRGAFDEAREQVAQARLMLDSAPRHSWLQYARLDSHLGNIWRADGLAEMGFDGLAAPGRHWNQHGAGTVDCAPGTPEYTRAMEKLQRAADLKVPAALAVDSVRYTIQDAGARARWASSVSAPMLAGAFAVAWESDNVDLTCELIEYHSARGAFSMEQSDKPGGDWAGTATAAVPVEAELAPELAIAAAAPSVGGTGVTRLGPLPPLRMDPGAAPIMGRYRELALQRYGQNVTAAGDAWRMWP